MQVLVTGGAGFIGSHLVDVLLEEGHRVRVLDDLSTGRRDNLARHAHHPRLALVRGSVTDQGTVDAVAQGCGVIYHLAAAIGVRYVVDRPLAGIATNVRGTELVLAAALRNGARVLLASSSEVYGKVREIEPVRPFGEDDDSLLGPTGVTRWWYALAKGLDEHLGFAYNRGYGLPVSAVRYFNVYGPRCDPGGYGVVARFVSQAVRGEPLTIFGDGQQRRSFTYVDDAVRATILAATEPAAIGEVFNVGSSREVTILAVASMVLRLTGSGSPIHHSDYQQVYGPRFEDTRRRVPDVAKAERILGFRPVVDLEEGLRRTVAWWAEASRPSS